MKRKVFDELRTLVGGDFETLDDRLSKGYDAPFKKICVTPAREFSKIKTFETADSGVALVFRKDVTNFYMELNRDRDHIVYYFDAKSKWFTNPSPREYTTKLTYERNDRISLVRSRSTPGLVRSAKGVVVEVKSKGVAIYLANKERTVTKERAAKTLFMIGIRFDDEIQEMMKQDLLDITSSSLKKQVRDD